MPEELPPGYVFQGPGRQLRDEDGDVVLSTWWYGPRVGRSDVPLVELCVSRRGARLRGTCSPEGLEVLLAEQGQRLRAAVVPLDAAISQDLRDAWRNVELTRHWADVGWIDQRPITTR